MPESVTVRILRQVCPERWKNLELEPRKAVTFCGGSLPGCSCGNLEGKNDERNIDPLFPFVLLIDFVDFFLNLHVSQGRSRFKKNVTHQ